LFVTAAAVDVRKKDSRDNERSFMVSALSNETATGSTASILVDLVKVKELHRPFELGKHTHIFSPTGWEMVSWPTKGSI
jgi:hypothetical protein